MRADAVSETPELAERAMAFLGLAVVAWLMVGAKGRRPGGEGRA